MKLSKKPSIFSSIIFSILESAFNFECSKKNMSLIAQVFLKWLTPKDVFIWMDNRACFVKLFGSERVNESQKLLKSAEKYFYPTFSSFWAQLSKKKLFLIRSESLGLLVNTSTANYEYSHSNRENLSLPIPIELSKEA